VLPTISFALWKLITVNKDRHTKINRLIELRWQSEVIKYWVVSSCTPEESREELRAMSTAIQKQLADLERELGVWNKLPKPAEGSF